MLYVLDKENEDLDLSGEYVAKSRHQNHLESVLSVWAKCLPTKAMDSNGHKIQ